jgi:hypothetical protein
MEPSNETNEDQTPAADMTFAATDATSNDSKPGFFETMETMTNKMFVAPVKGAAGKVVEGGNKLLVNPVNDASNKAKEVLHINNRGASRDVEATEEVEVNFVDAQPDDTLKKMNVIVNKQLKDVSIQDYYGTAWSEGEGTNKPPLYGPWLKESGKQEINIGKWEFADENTNFLGDWDGEEYSQTRVRDSVELFLQLTNRTHLLFILLIDCNICFQQTDPVSNGADFGESKAYSVLSRRR